MENKTILNYLIILIITAFILISNIIISNKYNKLLEKNFYLIGSNIININYNEKYIDEGIKATINNVDYKDKVSITSDVNTSKVGTYTISYTLKYIHFTKSIERTVNVIDNDFPILNVKCDKDIYLSLNEKFSGCNYTATDKYDGDISDKVIVNSNVDTSKKGTYQLKYTVQDSSSNETSVIINVHVMNKFDHTYIKVSISNQRLKYYVKNKVVLDTPITSGKHNLTRLGNFKIRKKVRNTYLIGKDYKSFVKYWMAYSGNSFGLHDASWRNSFGGKNYYYNGSHGCINMPTKAAEKLYNLVEIGTPVYIKK